MQYFFVLGTNPTLSIAEILAVFSDAISWQMANEHVFVIETIKEIDATKTIRRMGGVIKIGIIKGDMEFGEKEAMAKQLSAMIDIKKASGKFKFGISFYGKGKFNIKPVGMEIKKYLRENGVSARWVISREPALSSVVVEQNKLIEKGIEFVLVIPDSSDKNKKNLIVGQTLAVQPFKDLSFRDYGRPARDDYSGMLPPKLAQIMINLARQTSPPTPLLDRRGEIDLVILDPFCGSGTILTEAVLMGFKNIIGSDISAKAIEDTEKNIEWTKDNYELPITNYQLFNKSAKELSRFLKPSSIDMIVTEPYLGPQRGKVDYVKVKKELEKLYSESLGEFYKVLKPGGRAVMAWPVFRAANIFLNPNFLNFKIIKVVPEELRKNKLIKLTGRNTIVYGREGQKIWREIVVIEKK